MVDPYADDGYDPYAPVQAPPQTPPFNQWGLPPNSGQPAGTQDLSYWMSRGVNPDQIFNAEGQTNPGWSRQGPPGSTSSGYFQTGAAGPATAPGPTTGGPDPRLVYGRDPQTITPKAGGFDPYGSGYPAPQYPGYESAGRFEFDPFSPSSWADAENEPGYKASRDQLRKQVEAGAAYRGVLRSGATIGDIYTNLDALGQQNFKQFDDRRYRNWGGNRDLAASQYNFRAQDVDRGNNYRFNTADAVAKDALARWTQQVQSLTQLARPID